MYNYLKSQHQKVSYNSLVFTSLSKIYSYETHPIAMAQVMNITSTHDNYVIINNYRETLMYILYIINDLCIICVTTCHNR